MATRRTIIIVSILLGVGLELGVEVLSGRREAWDSGTYWIAGLPLVALAAAVVGFLSRDRAWLWTALIVPGQVMTMTVRSGEIGNLWPLAVALSAILSFPFVIAAFVGSRFRRKGAAAAAANSLTP
jgi:hypothetical protein